MRHGINRSIRTGTNLAGLDNPQSITDYHAKYFAWELTRRRTGGDVDRISQSLFDATVDLNPHQIEAAVFALRSPLAKGVLLADEVGLGKAIEAALVLSQLWAERKRRLLMICPASLRKQWAQELSEKFHLPTQVIDGRVWRVMRDNGIANPLDQNVISIMSLSYAARMESEELLQALKTGFERMGDMAAPRKAVIFTESRRTQEYLARYLEGHGYAGKVVTFSGSNQAPGVTGIYQRWLSRRAGSDRVTGSPAVDRRTALIDTFLDDAEIMIATEAGAEGINLQFCALVVNYDLPWNPQRVEQRIGRCHRYGQRFDVVVINFLNKRNEADQRVLELLRDKFQLFDGVFGASDDILGRLESGVDIERRIADIYDTCRTAGAIQNAFAALRKELEDSINKRMQDTEQALFEHFDAAIHERLRTRQNRAENHLDRISRLFWGLSRHVISSAASFNDTRHEFDLQHSPTQEAPIGRYRLVRKG